MHSTRRKSLQCIPSWVPGSWCGAWSGAWSWPAPCLLHKLFTLGCNCCCCCFWPIKCSVLSDEMRLLGAAACMIGRDGQGKEGRVCVLGSGLRVSCPPLYAHKNKFQDFIMPMSMSLSMCVQWTVCVCSRAGRRRRRRMTCNCNGTNPVQGGRGVKIRVALAVVCPAEFVFDFLQMFN